MIKSEKKRQDNKTQAYKKIKRRISNMQKKQSIITIATAALVSLLVVACNFPYKFTDTAVDPKLKTFKVTYIENKARYVNPQLSQKITDRLRIKIISQTKLTPTTGDADLEISGSIVQYDVSTSGVSNNQGATNRLNVGLSIDLTNNKEPDKSQKGASIVRNFDFAASLTINQAEAQLSDEIVKNVVDEIFNKIFSNW
jgi:hypothetical protein